MRAHTETLSFREKTLSFLLRSLPLRNGKHRLLDRLAPKPIGNPNRVIRMRFGGAELHIEIDDLVGWHFAMLRSFDPEVTAVLIAAATSGREVIWDIGANKGACAFALACALPDARIVAIEPQSRLEPFLVRNLEQLCPDRFEFYPVGLSVREGTATLTVPDGNTGSGTLHADRLRLSGRTEEIRLTTASAIAEKSAYGWPTLAKIDVEGHEATVLESVGPALERRICKALVFESHDQVAFASIADAVARFDYQIYAIRKTPFSTYLTRAGSPLTGATDYAIVQRESLAQNRRLASLVR